MLPFIIAELFLVCNRVTNDCEYGADLNLCICRLSRVISTITNGRRTVNRLVLTSTAKEVCESIALVLLVKKNRSKVGSGIVAQLTLL